MHVHVWIHAFRNVESIGIRVLRSAGRSCREGGARFARTADVAVQGCDIRDARVAPARCFEVRWRCRAQVAGVFIVVVAAACRTQPERANPALPLATVMESGADVAADFGIREARSCAVVVVTTDDCAAARALATNWVSDLGGEGTALSRSIQMTWLVYATQKAGHLPQWLDGLPVTTRAGGAVAMKQETGADVSPVTLLLDASGRVARRFVGDVLPALSDLREICR